MANKTVKIADFRNRIKLLKSNPTVDAELNRIEKFDLLQEVWANIEVKASNYEKTSIGTKPKISYKVVLRKTSCNFDAVRWNGKIYHLLAPEYVIENKYTVFEMAITGEENG